MLVFCPQPYWILGPEVNKLISDKFNLIGQLQETCKGVDRFYSFLHQTLSTDLDGLLVPLTTQAFLCDNNTASQISYSSSNVHLSESASDSKMTNFTAEINMFMTS